MNYLFSWLCRCLWKVVVVAILTTAHTSDARAFEVKTNDNGDLIRWEDESIDLCLGAELLERFGVEPAVRAAEGAAAAWSGIPNAPEIRISVSNTRAFDPERLSGCVHLARSWMSDGGELALTYSASDSSGYIRATDIVLNGQHRFGIAGAHLGSPRFDLQAVLTHEMGHLLGLAENPDDTSSTMHPDIGCGETFQRDITDDDRSGIEYIYASGPKSDAGTCTLAGDRTEFSPLFWAILAACGLGFRRRGRIVHAGGG